MTPNETMIDYDFADGAFEIKPFDPFQWNECYLDGMEKGTTQKGMTKYLLRLKPVRGDGVIFHSILFDEKGRMMFESEHMKILMAFVQHREKTIAEALRKAKGNKNVTVWVRCEMDGQYVRIKECKATLSETDKLNAALASAVLEAKEQANNKEDDDDLPV